jgi:hypothetical protein
MKAFLIQSAWMLALLGCSQVHSEESLNGCPFLGQPFGDYLVDKDKVQMSERFHFTPEVESLIRGKSDVRIGGDIDFMLSNYPNHHRALVAMMRLGEKLKSPQPAGARAPIECYFERAVRFRPDDLVARMLYATFLARNGRNDDASRQLELVKKLAPDDAFSQYNVGMIYMDMKDYDKALEQARRASELGFARADLRDRLKKVGRWKDPEPASSYPSRDGVESQSRAASASK